jgi:hypothetical protein
MKIEKLISYGQRDKSIEVIKFIDVESYHPEPEKTSPASIDS